VLTDLHEKPGQLRDMLSGDAAQPQQGQVRLPTSCHPRWPRPCSRASRPWWSSGSSVGSRHQRQRKENKENTYLPCAKQRSWRLVQCGLY
jgi:hypothetical protein